MLLAGTGSAATLVLNEYNAVSASDWLNGGNAAADLSGGQAGDATFGRVQGNGGDWFELVVTEGGVDLRGWQLEIRVQGSLAATLVLSQDPIWTGLQAGTLITIAEDQPEDVSYDPASGDWTIHTRAGVSGTGAYISALEFPVNNDDWQLTIRDAQGLVRFGPAGEGIAPGIGINGREVFRLEDDPSELIVEDWPCYDDGDTRSTYGLANEWANGAGSQDFTALRTGGAPTSQCSTVDLSDLAFAPDHILDVDIVVDPADFEALRRQQRTLMETFGGRCGDAPAPDPYTFFPADVTVDGTTVSMAGLRKKGFFGSLDREKPSLKIDFGEYGSETTVYGLDRLTLNNGRQDPSLLDQCLGYSLYRAAGLAAARCNFAHVTVNGTSFGIYMNVESIQEPFLVRNFGSSTGNLYEGSTADFREHWIGVFEKKNNTDGTDLAAVQAAIEISDDAQSLAALAALVDLDKFLTFWALDGLIGNWDGYTGNANNFWLYRNPATGLFEFLPWSLDDIFGRDNPFSDPGSDQARTVFDTAALSNRLWRMPGYPALYEARINQLLSTVWDEATLLAEIDRMQLLIEPIAGDLSGPIAETRDFIDGRAAKVVADFANGPPAASTLSDKYCLEIQGQVVGDFTARYADPIPSGLPANSTFTPTSFDFDGATSLTGVGTAFGFDPAVGSGKLVLRPIGLTGFPYGLVFNIAIDEGDVVAGTPTPIPVSDSIASLLLVLDAIGPQVFPIGAVVDTTLTLDQADLTPGGTVSGSFASDLATWVPHPAPEPSGGLMLFAGVVTLSRLARMRARRHGETRRIPLD